MIVKDYYRFDELNTRFNIQEADLDYWLEKEQISFVIPQPIQNYIIGGWIKGKDFRGYGVVQYKGLIYIPNNKIKVILEKGKSHIEGCWLFEREKITYLSQSYGFDIPIPNGFVNSWQPKALAEISWNRIPAKRYPNIVKSPTQLLRKAIDSIKDNKVRPISYLELDVDNILSAPDLVIRKQELCITHLDLVKLGIVADNEPSLITGASPAKVDEQPKPAISIEEPQTNKSIKYANDFDELLATILTDNRSLKLKGVLRILTLEARADEHLRKYDTRNILLDEVEGRFVWCDHYGTISEKTYASKTIGNRLTEVRKLLK